MPKVGKVFGNVGGEGKVPSEKSLEVNYRQGENVTTAKWAGIDGASSVEQSERECFVKVPKSINEIKNGGGI